MTRRRIVAAGFGLIGMLLIVHPEGFRSGTYDVVASIAPLTAWGWAFVIVAVTAALSAVPRSVAVALIAGHTATWAGGLAAANLTGDAVSPVAWVPWVMLVALVLHAAGRPADG
jgi:hypothetical protein